MHMFIIRLKYDPEITKKDTVNLHMPAGQRVAVRSLNENKNMIYCITNLGKYLS